MVEALRRACTGMRNLMQTCKDDAALASQIRVLVQEVEDFVQVIATHGEHLAMSSPRPDASSSYPSPYPPSPRPPSPRPSSSRPSSSRPSSPRPSSSTA